MSREQPRHFSRRHTVVEHKAQSNDFGVQTLRDSSLSELPWHIASDAETSCPLQTPVYTPETETCYLHETARVKKKVTGKKQKPTVARRKVLG